MSEHTPKPWKSTGPNYFYICAQDGRIITRVSDMDTGTEQAEANARLIAAAPNLLEALVVSRDALSKVAEGLKAYNNPSAENIQQILGGVMAFSDAALAKARGEASR